MQVRIIAMRVLIRIKFKIYNKILLKTLKTVKYLWKINNNYYNKNNFKIKKKLKMSNN